MLNQQLQSSLNDAFTYAHELSHEFVTLEHLLLVLLENPQVTEILDACNGDIESLKEDLLMFIHESNDEIENEADLNVQPTLGFQRVIQRAIYQVQSSGQDEVTGGHIIVSMYSEPESQAVYLLEKQKIDRLDVVTYMSHGMSDDSFDFDKEIETDEGESSTDPLSKFAENLNEKAMAGNIDPLIGRDEEINRTIQVLVRRRKNNPLFVGEAGVGKTSLAEGLALRIVNGDVPEILRTSQVFALDLGSMLAGTKYRGDFEKRLKAVLKQVNQVEHAILFIDEIHTIIGAGSTGGGSLDASNLIKPALADGRLRCIGATTYDEYRTIFEKDRALARRFQKVDVPEPTVDETVQILKGLKPYFEKHHEVKYTNQAIHKAAELSARYMTDRHLPDKAIDVLDEAGAKQRITVASKRKKQIGVADIESIVAGMARIPVTQVNSSEKTKLKSLESDLERVVYGQEEAIDRVSTAMKMARANLKDENKPIASFLFAGPTGVGKTELCRQLSKIAGLELIRFDMSEYMERHAVSRLIGAPPGYVGYESGGLLTEAVTKHPHSIVLLDEIEKAHPDLFNLLLQVMDHGTLTDNNGRKADFRNVMLVMTSNVGAETMSRSSFGFVEQSHAADFGGELKKLFTPEFRNRLDAVVQFKALGEEQIARVVDKNIIELQEQLSAQKVKINLSAEAREWLVKHGYEPAMGARPMRRLIQDKIRKPLANELLFGNLVDGGEVEVVLKDDELMLQS